MSTPEDIAIAQTALHRYARAVDRGDAESLAEVFTEDVVLERADGTREGKDAVLAFYRRVFEGPTVWSKHLITNLLVRPRAGGLAATSCFQAVSRTTNDAIAIFGEYDDLLVPFDAGMRIARKRIDVQQTFQMEPRDA